MSSKVQLDTLLLDLSFIPLWAEWRLMQVRCGMFGHKERLVRQTDEFAIYYCPRCEQFTAYSLMKLPDGPVERRLRVPWGEK